MQGSRYWGSFLYHRPSTRDRLVCKADLYHIVQLSVLRWKVYVALKKWSSFTAREVKTRDWVQGSTSCEDDSVRAWPEWKPVACQFRPNDSKHGGKLFCTSEVVGEPPLVDIMKVYDAGGSEKGSASWLGEVVLRVRRAYGVRTVWHGDRRAGWEYFCTEVVPRRGTNSLEDTGRLPTLALDTSAAKRPPAPTPGDCAAKDIVHNLGRGASGRVRLCFKDGVDTAKYEQALLWANFSGRLVDGTSYGLRKEQECK